MLNISLNTLYGQRFSIDESEEILSPIDPRLDWVLPGFKIFSQTDLVKFERSLKKILKQCTSALVLPALELDFGSNPSVLDTTLHQITTILEDCEIKKIVLCVDEDNSAIHGLSPRYSDEVAQIAMQRSISRSIEFFSTRKKACLVALTIEELCPGGSDPKDGIELARQFVDSGASAIIASGGSRDFEPLKYRRETQQKNRENFQKSWSQPWLSSAQWLIGKINVPILAQGPISDVEKSLIDAGRIRLNGVVGSSVMYPSAP